MGGDVFTGPYKKVSVFDCQIFQQLFFRFFEKSVIYDLTFGEKNKSLKILKNKTNANISFGLPQWLVNDISNDLENEKNPIQPDFILVLGRDADKSKSGTENILN